MVSSSYLTRRPRRARPRGHGCPGTYRQKAYELSSSPPDAVTVVRAGHPLHGQQLRVDRGGGRRHDGNVQVVLPDGSPALMPIGWVEAGAQPTAQPSAATERRFTAAGLRRLLGLVDAMSRDAGQGSFRP